MSSSVKKLAVGGIFFFLGEKLYDVIFFERNYRELTKNTILLTRNQVVPVKDRNGRGNIITLHKKICLDNKKFLINEETILFLQ
jgi:hypothetical protein